MVVEIEGVVYAVVPVPPASGKPPVAAAYQSIVFPTAAEAVIVTVPVPHRESPTPVGAAGRVKTFTDRVAVAFEQPPVPETV